MTIDLLGARRRLRGAVCNLPLVGLLAGVAAYGQAQQYTSKILTPVGSTAAKLNGAANGQQVGRDGLGHAMLLSGDASTVIDLHPGGFTSSTATATDGVTQCGYADGFAVKWSGSAASVIVIGGGSSAAICTGVHGSQAVGWATSIVFNGANLHASLWDGSASADLHPLQFFPGIFAYSKALGVKNSQQVGYGSKTISSNDLLDDTTSFQDGQALLWTGTAASVKILHPLGYASSRALATTGIEQGGWATNAVTLNRHAMLWSHTDRIGIPSSSLIGAPGLPDLTPPPGTAGIALDLHPAAYTDSRINALNDTQQVGDGWVGTPGAPGSVRHALVWSGIAASAIDLNQFLPAGYIHAVATGIDANGNVVGYAYNDPAVPGVFTSTFPVDSIALLFTPAPIPAVSVSTVTLSPTYPAPGDTVQGIVTLSGLAPAGGILVNFQSSDPTLLAAPASMLIAEGQSSAAFAIAAGGVGLQVPAIAKILASDGATSRVGNVVITPVVNISSVSVAPIEGGLPTTVTLTLNIPAQFGGAPVTVTFGNPALVSLTNSTSNSVVVPQGSITASFRVSTTAVTAITSVSVAASFNGQTVSSTVTLNPPPPIAISTLTIPSVVGGQSTTGTVTVNNYPRNVGGIVIALTSGDAKTLQVPVTVTIPQFGFSATFPVTTTVVTGSKGVSVKAVYGTSNVSTTVTVNPIPAISIVQADYLTDTQTLKVAATTTGTTAVLTYGIDPIGPALGTLSFELGQYKASTTLLTAPASVTVWSADGGKATLAVTQRLSTGGGGGGATTTYKISISKNGKGTVTTNPAAASYAPGTVVTLTALPDVGSTWTGWTGACTGAALTCTVTVNSNLSVTANFR